MTLLKVGDLVKYVGEPRKDRPDSTERLLALRPLVGVVVAVPDLGVTKGLYYSYGVKYEHEELLINLEIDSVELA